LETEEDEEISMLHMETAMGKMMHRKVTEDEISIKMTKAGRPVRYQSEQHKQRWLAHT
jgi:hypothetical protein